MKEQDLIKLGFVKFEVNAEESGGLPFYYYTFNFTDDTYGLSLISNDDEKASKVGWQVEIFDYDHILFKNIKDISDFINIIKQNLHEK